MQDHHAELIDLDLFCEIEAEATIIETIRDGELFLVFLKHPVRGFLTGVQAGNAVLLVRGGYADLRERAFRLCGDILPETP
ncbi:MULTISPECIES: hypothetical protein [unclassified Brevundimonas]|uniref:hypothetical protein n=1 Tax=unclassified Brevundimonas TaxID=2622653 RepID=UPI0025C08AFE|nr:MULTISPECIES: hypothetical protein [unclassified Brevundimonas]